MNTKNPLPIRGKLSYIYIASIFIAILFAVGSVSGILFRDWFYPTEALIQTFVPNDVVNLLVGLPILLVSMWLSWRGKLVGLLLWPGALFFVIYNSIAYVFALPFSWGFTLQLVLFVCSLYTLIAITASIDGEIVKDQLKGVVRERLSGGVIAGFGILFILRVMIVIGNALIKGDVITATDLAPNISDLLVSPAFVIVGVSLWKQKVFGYVAGLGMLFQASMLFVGLIIFLLLQPILTAASFSFIDVFVVFVMGLICFIPFVLFLRGVLAKSN